MKFFRFSRVFIHHEKTIKTAQINLSLGLSFQFISNIVYIPLIVGCLTTYNVANNEKCLGNGLENKNWMGRLKNWHTHTHTLTKYLEESTYLAAVGC